MPGFYLAYPSLSLTADGQAHESIAEAGMELPEEHIKAMITFLQECLPIFHEKPLPTNVVPFKRKT